MQMYGVNMELICSIKSRELHYTLSFIGCYTSDKHNLSVISLFVLEINL